MMSHPTAFDSLAAARRLEEAGFDRQQAEAAASEMRSAVTADTEHLATKAGLQQTALGILIANAAIRADPGQNSPQEPNSLHEAARQALENRLESPKAAQLPSFTQRSMPSRLRSLRAAAALQPPESAETTRKHPEA